MLNQRQRMDYFAQQVINGLVLGSGFARGIIVAVNTETVRLPLVLTAANYAFAVLVVAFASALSAIFAARKLAEIDLVSALKALD